MRVWVAFIWTDKREVGGQWHYELKKIWATQWAKGTGKHRDFEHYFVTKSMAVIRENQSRATGKNLKTVLSNFLRYADGTKKDIFIDLEPGQRKIVNN
jgi:hypothetical protein